MHIRVMGRKICLLLLVLLFCFTGCSTDELLSQVPETFRIGEESGWAEGSVSGNETAVNSGNASQNGGDAAQGSTNASQNGGDAAQGSTNASQNGGDAAEGSTSVNQNGGNTAQGSTITGQSAINSEQELSFLNPQASTYAYGSLSPEQQIWYKDIEQALGGMKEEIRLSEEGLDAGLNESNIDLIFQCVLNDHPEIFYVDGYTYTKYSRGEEIIAIDFSGTYQMDAAAALSNMMEIEQGAELFLTGISGDASEYDKIKYVFDTIIKNTDYDLNAPDNQNIYSVFVGRRSVCQGYAKATQYLLNRLGMECTLVQGTVDGGEGHVWNLVRVDGSWYYVDTTWGDASYRMQGTSQTVQQMPEVNYDYLCVTTEQLLRTHTLKPYVPVPECVDTAANYYVREGALLTDYDTEQLQQLFQRMMEENRTDLTIKCSDTACYNKVLLSLINNQDIFDFLPGDYGKVSYAHNEEQLSLTFWVTNP